MGIVKRSITLKNRLGTRIPLVFDFNEISFINLYCNHSATKTISSCSTTLTLDGQIVYQIDYLKANVPGQFTFFVNGIPDNISDGVYALEGSVLVVELNLPIDSMIKDKFRDIEFIMQVNYAPASLSTALSLTTRDKL
jgi:hypothetical protein